VRRISSPKAAFLWRKSVPSVRMRSSNGRSTSRSRRNQLRVVRSTHGMMKSGAGRNGFAAFWDSVPNGSYASRPDFRAMRGCGRSPRNCPLTSNRMGSAGAPMARFTPIALATVAGSMFWRACGDRIGASAPTRRARGRVC